MKILRFSCSALYGHLDLDISFQSDVSILTGINGCGKTSALRCIAALLVPSLRALAHLSHEEMCVEIQHLDRIFAIRSRHTENGIELSIDGQLHPLIFEPASEEGDARIPDTEITDYYDDLLRKHTEHPVLVAISELPVPMVLGIARSGSGLFERQTDRPRTYVRSRRPIRTPFRTYLGASLREAVQLAEQKHRNLELALRNLSSRLRQDIIKEAIQYKEAQPGAEERPKIGDLQRFSEQLENAVQTLSELGLEEDYIREQFTQMLEKLRELAEKIPEDYDEASLDMDEMVAIYEWSANKSQYDRIFEILRLVDGYIDRCARVRDPIQRYLDVLNGFFVDGKKVLEFNHRGILIVRDSLRNEQPVTGLSSGETQLLVIITHLSFNDDARDANVFIIDEPELSLHVKWQEGFVDAIMEASPETQLILATHSPSIILDRVENCCDLSGAIE